MDEGLVAQYPDLERAHFWWKTRRDFVRAIVESIAGDSSPTVLDVGCGSGMTSRMLARMGSTVVGVDNSFSGDHVSDANVSYLRDDYIRAAPGLGEFDLVLALDSVEHFEDERAVLRAVCSNVKVGGYALVTVPAFSWLWSAHDVRNGHYRRYTAPQLRSALSHAALTTDRIGYLFGGLVPLKAVLGGVERLFGADPGSGTQIGALSNECARRYFGLETSAALRRQNFLPLGTSVAALARRSA